MGSVTVEIENLSQINFLPRVLTDFAFHAPNKSGDNYTEEMEEKVNEAIAEAGFKGTPRDLADGDPREKDRWGVARSNHKNKLFIEGPIILMVEYATNKIDEPFHTFLVGIFGDERVKKAPVKSCKRILSKKERLKQKHHHLWEELNKREEVGKQNVDDFQEAEEAGQEAWNSWALGGHHRTSNERIILSTWSYGIEDVVRGS